MTGPAGERSRHLLDPEMAPLFEMRPDYRVSDATLAGYRQAMVEMPPLPAEIVDAVERRSLAVPGPAGAPPIGIELYLPRAAARPLPAILHFHGGGFVFGQASAMEVVHRPFALAHGCALASVEYRLAPETKFPGQVEDGYAALTWLAAEAPALGIDPARIGVMGESAGGGLAAALALYARDRGGPALAFQHLVFPMLDDRTGLDPDPSSPFAGEFVWTRESNRYGWRALLGDAVGGPDVSPYAAPARATRLEGLPPTFIATPTLDLFVDENIDYAHRLIRAGVPCALHVYPGGVHGFHIVPNAAIAIDARRDMAAALNRALHPGSPEPGG